MVNCYEDNQATIIVVKKGFSPKLRHITRTHKVDLGSLAEVMNEDSFNIQYVNTTEQAADIFTKALQPQKWGAALQMLNIVDFNTLHQPQTLESQNTFKVPSVSVS